MSGDPNRTLYVHGVYIVPRSSFHEFIVHVEQEKRRVIRDSRQAAAFLLIGKTRYLSVLGVFIASDVRRYLPIEATLDDRGGLETVLGLTIVIDPVHEHRLEVIGPVSWEAYR
jgi:hypothetical protein